MNSDWTVDTLKEYVESQGAACRRHTDDRFEAMEEETSRALASAEKAVEKAERLADVRADVQDRIAAERSRQQNEWRASLSDLGQTMLTRSEWAVQHQMLVERLEAHEKAADREMSQLRERSNSARTLTLILTALLTAVFTMLVYLIFLHIR